MSGEPLRVAAALVLRPDGRIFFQKRSAQRKLFPNSWDVVGGHLEPGETVEEALARELHEETGWHLAEIVATVGDYRYRGEDGLERHETDFLVLVHGDLERPTLEEGKHTEFRWLGPDELDVLDESAHINDGMIRQLAEDGFAVLRARDM